MMSQFSRLLVDSRLLDDHLGIVEGHGSHSGGGRLGRFQEKESSA
jgi:hypothetical protein